MKEIRLALIGKTGTGKSALGNSLLGKLYFKSIVGAESTTSVCQLGVRTLDDGTVLKVIDTPGLFDTRMTGDMCSSRLLEAFKLLGTGGIHMFLLVLRVGRFTQEEKDAVTFLKILFGDKIVEHIVIVLTHKDDLEAEGISLAEYLQNSPPYYPIFIQECGNRIVSISNRGQMIDRENDVKTILNLVRNTISVNGESFCYSENMFRDIQEAKEQEKSTELGMEGIEANRKVEELKRQLTALTRQPSYSTAVAANTAENSCTIR